MTRLMRFHFITTLHNKERKIATTAASKQTSNIMGRSVQYGNYNRIKWCCFINFISTLYFGCRVNELVTNTKHIKNWLIKCFAKQ
ncbi:CLUMA_CG014591, isoform A [Clunio marinus]|uniref:CLUMA_CG014591, isoform A n=1 Tax=Clunio marinus TaxID=568069 RepID=A0A1J1IMX0_9DIPT|nr:CLUMA_CG014591, isoform A [Clunio marinus]